MARPCPFYYHLLIPPAPLRPPCLSIRSTMRVSVKVQGLALLVLLMASASLTQAAAPAYDKPPGEPSPVITGTA